MQVRVFTFLVIMVLSVGLVGTFLSNVEGFTGVMSLATLFAPIAIVPFAASDLARDRDTRMDEVIRVASVPSSDYLIAKAVSFLILGTMASLLNSVLLLQVASSLRVGLTAIVPFLPWWGLILVTSVVAGLAAGLSFINGRLGALSAGFILLMVWVALGIATRQILGLARTTFQARALEAIVLFSPSVWARMAVGRVPRLVDLAHLPLTYAFVTSFLVPAILVAMVLGRHRLLGGWRPLKGDRRAIVAVVVIALLAGGSWFAASQIPKDAETGPPRAHIEGAVGSGFHPFTDLELFAAAEPSVPVNSIDYGQTLHGTVLFEANGSSNRTLTIDGISIENPYVQTTVHGSFPTTINGSEGVILPIDTSVNNYPKFAVFTANLIVRVDLGTGVMYQPYALIVEPPPFPGLALLVAVVAPLALIGIAYWWIFRRPSGGVP